MAHLLFMQWLIGFIEGDGNFQVTAKPNKNKKTGEITSYTVGYSFYIGLSLVDLYIVQTIQSALGMGNILTYPNKGITGEAHFSITTKVDLLLFALVLMQYPFLTIHQWTRFFVLYTGLTQGITNFQTLEAFHM